MFDGNETVMRESGNRWSWQLPLPEKKSATTMTLAKWGIALAVAALFAHYGHFKMAWIVTSIASTITLLAFFAPGAHAAIERFLTKLGLILGGLLTWILLVPFFFLVVTAVAVVLRVRGIDPMARRPDPTVTTYWVARGTSSSEKDFTRQF